LGRWVWIAFPLRGERAMGKRKHGDDGGGDYIAPKGMGPSGPGQMALAARGEPRRASLEIDEVPRPKKTKPQNLQKLSFEDLNQRKHDLKMEENYHSNVMGIKKRGPYSASDVRASYTQVLRFQYLQKEVDLEIERREAKKESQAEAKARKKQEKEDANRAQRAAIQAAQEEAFARPGVVASGDSFVSFNDMGKSFNATSSSMSRSADERPPDAGMSKMQQIAIANAMRTNAGMGAAFGSSQSEASPAMASGAVGGSSGGSESSGQMNPMMAMAQMMLETQKKLKEAQEKMNKVSEVTGTGSSSSGFAGGCGGGMNFGGMPAAFRR